MKRVTLFVLLLLLVGWPANAEKKIHFNVETSYLFGIKESTDYCTYERDSWNIYGLSLHLSTMWNFSRFLSAGAGVGLDRYNNPGYNTLPIFIALQSSPFNSVENFHAFANFGLCVNSKTFSGGEMLELGIGYKFRIKKEFGISFRFGYNLRWSEHKPAINLPDKGELFFVDIEDMFHTRQSICAGIGLVF